MRTILTVRQLVERPELPWTTRWQIDKLIRHPTNPLPFKKAGGKLLFDLDRVYRWFDSLPGKDTLE